MMNQDTICAIATAQGGAIGSIRVSGPEAISITSLIFKPAKPDKLFSDQKPYSLTFGRIYDGGGSRCRFNRILICRYPSASHESDEGWLQQRIN